MNESDNQEFPLKLTKSLSSMWILWLYITLYHQSFIDEWISKDEIKTKIKVDLYFGVYSVPHTHTTFTTDVQMQPLRDDVYYKE